MKTLRLNYLKKLSLVVLATIFVTVLSGCGNSDINFNMPNQMFEDAFVDVTIPSEGAEFTIPLAIITDEEFEKEKYEFSELNIEGTNIDKIMNDSYIELAKIDRDEMEEGYAQGFEDRRKEYLESTYFKSAIKTKKALDGFYDNNVFYFMTLYFTFDSATNEESIIISNIEIDGVKHDVNNYMFTYMDNVGMEELNNECLESPVFHSQITTYSIYEVENYTSSIILSRVDEDTEFEMVATSQKVEVKVDSKYDTISKMEEGSEDFEFEYELEYSDKKLNAFYTTVLINTSCSLGTDSTIVSYNELVEFNFWNYYIENK